MAKIIRATQSVFCGAVSEVDNIAQFGSLKAGSPVFSDDPDVIQGISAFGEGWKSAIVENKSPPLQDMNALFYLLTRQVAYAFQAGIPEYDVGTEYHINSYCQDAGVVYVSLQNSNTNNALSNASWWRVVLTPTSSGGTLGMVPLGTVVPIGNAQAWALPASGQVKDGYALCNGQTFASLPGGSYASAFSGSLPNVSDDRFLMGSTAIGAAAGANTVTLTPSNIPQNSTNYTPAGTTNIGHSHSLGTTNVALGSGATNSTGYHSHTIPAYSGAAGGFIPGASVAPTTPLSRNTGGDGTHDHTVTGTTNIDHSHTLSTTNVALAGTTATITIGTASPTAFNNRPKYLPVVYVMRVK